NLCRSPNTANRLDVNIFDRAAGDLGACRYSVDVQFQRVGAGLGNSPRVADPATEGSAIQATDDWNPDGALGSRDVLKVRVRIDAKFRGSGFDLLFEQRMKNHRCRARLFHRADVVDLLRKRRGRRHQRQTQRQAKIVRRQIHRLALTLDRKMTVGRLVSTKWAISTEQCGQMMRIATLTKRFAG